MVRRPTAATALAFMLACALAALGFAVNHTILLGHARAAPFDQAVFNPIGDAVITSQFPEQNYGEIGDLAVAVRSTDAIDVYDYDRSLLRFDLSTLPAGAEIDTAILEVYQKGTTGADSVQIWAFPVTDTWNETDVTWNNQPTFDTAHAQTATLDTSDGYKSWDVTDFARDWLAGSGYGVVLHGPEAPPAFVRTFHSHDLNEFIPRLTVTFHVPPPVGDLVMEQLISTPNPALVNEPIQPTATVHNVGTAPYANVPVHFYVDGSEFAVETIDTLAAGATEDVSVETSFDTEAVYALTAHVNPAATLDESNPDNNEATVDQSILSPSVGDLVLEQLISTPNPALANQPIRLTATVHNVGTTPYANVPVHFYVGGSEFAVETIDTLAAGATEDVSVETSFDTEEVYPLTAHVNPAATLDESNPDNNEATIRQLVVVELNPVWSKPDGSLAGLTFTPARPNAGQNVTVAADLQNLGRADLASVLVALFVDGQVVDEAIVTDIPAGTTRLVTLHYANAAAGRHYVSLVLDPELTLNERSTSNSTLSEWLRVAGAADPLADIEVSAIRLQESAQNATLPAAVMPIEVELYNAGYVAVTNLPVEILVDGQRQQLVTVANIGPGQISSLPLPLPHPGRGNHVVTARIDPDNTLSLDFVQREWAVSFLFPTPDFRPEFYTFDTADEMAGRWTFIGPQPMRREIGNTIYYHNGRVDGLAVSQDARIMVVGSAGGGIWRTEDYGKTWDPITDPLNQPEFTRVALDPKDPDIVYGLSGASYSIYKSLNGGESWSLFANRLVNQAKTGFTKMLVRYESANTVTLYVADKNGLWMWQGDPKATSATNWQRVWQQTRNAHPKATSEVTDLHITSESTPYVYIGALHDAVYRIKLADLLSAVSQNKTPTWTALETGMTLGSDAVRFFIASSPANAGRVFTLISRSTECANKAGTTLDLYRRDSGSTSWTHVSTPTDVTKKPNICGIRYAAFLAVNPAKANLLYIGGVPGYRSTDGGATFPNKITYVHDDYKAVAFNPSDPSMVFFTSDGGIYRCTKDGAVCGTLNNDLETGMFFDIAVAGAQTPLIIGGTQDNGTLRYDGKLEWKYIRWGDGRYCAIDPTNNDIMYSQHQHAVDMQRSTTGGEPWTTINSGLPTREQFTGNPYLVMHPSTPTTLLIAAGTANGQAQVYRTVNSGTKWDPIGPAPALTRGQIGPIVIDGANNRYYAAAKGEIWATSSSNAGANGWTRIHQDLTQGDPREMVLDPDNPNTLYAVFDTGGANRVIELVRTGGSWPGTAANWQATDIGGGLPNKVAGGPNDAVRGLAVEPNPGSATVLYVGTDRGVYQGRRETNTTNWAWALDSCGMPRTYISDLAVHSSDAWIAAATYGRGVYTRNTGNTIGTADAYEQPVRNDTLANAATLPPMVLPQWPLLYPSLVVNGLTLERGDDVDYFKVKMPPHTPGTCLPANDPLLGQPGVNQCTLAISIHAPDTPDPYEIALYRSDGSVYLEPTTTSGLNVSIKRPYDVFTDGELTLRVRDLTSCRSRYDLYFWFSNWVIRKDVPELLYEPPLVNRIVPELGDFPWVFPDDPVLIDRGFLEPLDDLPEQRVTFPWNGGPFGATLTVEGGRDLNMTLYNAQNQPIAEGPLVTTAASDGGAVIKAIQLETLPAGWYALGFHGGTFLTYFSVDVSGEHLFLPLLQE